MKNVMTKSKHAFLPGMMSVVTGVLLSACISEKEASPETSNEVIPEIFKYCDVEIELISAEDSVPLFFPNYSLEQDQLLDSIESICGYDICNRYSWFALAHGIESLPKTVASYTYKYCEKMVAGCILYPRDFDIWVDTNERILANDTMRTLEEISPAIVSYYDSDRVRGEYKMRNVRLRLKWQVGINSETVAGIIDRVIAGYLSAVNGYSLRAFGTETCAVSEEQKLQLIREMPFQFELKLQEEIVPEWVEVIPKGW